MLSENWQRRTARCWNSLWFDFPIFCVVKLKINQAGEDDNEYDRTSYYHVACVQSNPGNVRISTIFLQLILIDIQFPECNLFGKGLGLATATPKKQPKEKAYPQAMSPTSPVLLKPATPVAVMASTTPILTVPVLQQLPFYPQNRGWGKFSSCSNLIEWMNCSSLLQADAATAAVPSELEMRGAHDARSRFASLAKSKGGLGIM